MKYSLLLVLFCILGIMVAAQTRDDSIATCGGEAVRASQGADFSLDPFMAQGISDRCAGWRNEMVCCSSEESGNAGNRTDAMLGSWSTANSIAATVGEDLHCFYGFYQPHCNDVATWLQCATACDVLFPRNPETGQQKTKACYEKFTSRKGLDRIVLGGAETVCTRAMEIELGECDYVVVVADSDTLDERIAIAVGNNRAICYTSLASSSRWKSYLWHRTIWIVAVGSIILYQ